ncbi:hypothetical protein AB0469_35125 [Streptomyces sp. NPDC093801]|uniref:hypothetical protein n=1 Tax=Streptomyces sp. NPDC093801 TaxID=3155203 RepID=UPI00344CA1E4
MSSLDSETGFPHTSDPHTLMRLTTHDRATVFATIASAGNGIPGPPTKSACPPET